VIPRNVAVLCAFTVPLIVCVYLAVRGVVFLENMINCVLLGASRILHQFAIWLLYSCASLSALVGDLLVDHVAMSSANWLRLDPGDGWGMSATHKLKMVGLRMAPWGVPA